MKPKPFRIFRAGTHTDSAGTATTFTAEQLGAMVAAYNDGKWRAPMVVGHPKGTAPAYGWVGKLRLDESGDVFVDDVDKLNPDFAELMKSGAYRNRSASLYSPDHPNNPTPGVWQLRHLGILGAQPPALKGLGDVEFGDQDGITVEFSDTAEADWSLAGLFETVTRLARGIREALIADKGVEEADKVMPSWRIDEAMAQQIRAEERARAKSDPSLAFSEPNPEDSAVTLTPEQIADLQAKAARADQLAAENATLAATNTTLQGQVTSFTEQQTRNARAVLIADCAGALNPLVKDGKVLPADVAALAEYMAGLDDNAKVVNFGEATGDNALTARGMFLQTLKDRAPVVDYSEQTGNVQLPSNIPAAELGARANEYREGMAAKGVILTATQAVDAVIAGKTVG